MMEIMMGAKYRMTFFVCVLNCVCCFGELEDKREAMKALCFAHCAFMTHDHRPVQYPATVLAIGTDGAGGFTVAASA